MSDELDRVDAIFLRINLILLLFVTFLPFPTRLVGEALRDVPAERVFVTLYGLTLLAMRLLLFALDSYAARERLYSKVGDEEDDEDLRRDRRKLLPVLAGYVIAILIGLAFPVVAVALYLALAVYLVVPFREVGPAVPALVGTARRDGQR
jgi:TMEM175 potassium channel family protein